MRRRAFGLDRAGDWQLERPERQVVPVAAEVGHRPVAEIPPAVPSWAGQIDLVERAVWRRAEPQVPVQSRRHRRGFGWPLLDETMSRWRSRFLFALPAPGAADPHMDLAHRADRSRLDQLHHPPVIVAGMDLRPHLRSDLGLAAASRISRASQMLYVSGFSQ